MEFMTVAELFCSGMLKITGRKMLKSTQSTIKRKFYPIFIGEISFFYEITHARPQERKIKN